MCAVEALQAVSYILTDNNVIVVCGSYILTDNNVIILC